MKHFKEWLKAAAIRAFRTLVQAAASSAIVAIGSATTMGDVNWVLVASTAGLSAILSLLTSLATGLPEVKENETEERKLGSLEINTKEPEEGVFKLKLTTDPMELKDGEKVQVTVKKDE